MKKYVSIDENNEIKIHENKDDPINYQQFDG